MFGKGEILHQRKVEIRLSERAELRRQAGNVAKFERLRKTKGRGVEIARTARDPAQAAFDIANAWRTPERPERHDTGSQRGKGKWVAAVPRQIGYLFTGNGLSERGGFGLHQDRFFIDSDDIGDLAHLKWDVDSRGLIDRQLNSAANLAKPDIWAVRLY